MVFNTSVVSMLFLLVAVAHCGRRMRDTRENSVRNYEFVRGASNAYHFGFDTSDGTSRQEDGKDDDEQNLAIDGSVSWVSQDGSRYLMTYKADRYGYRPIIKRISGP